MTTMQSVKIVSRGITRAVSTYPMRCLVAKRFIGCVIAVNKLSNYNVFKVISTAFAHYTKFSTPCVGVCVVLSVSFSHQPRRSKCVVIHCLYRYVHVRTYVC